MSDCYSNCPALGFISPAVTVGMMAGIPRAAGGSDHGCACQDADPAIRPVSLTAGFPLTFVSIL
jgi:hypothetical protein